MMMETTSPMLLLADAVTAFLESPWKPFLLYLPFVPWAWLVSSKLDKDARQHHLNPTMWNSIHLGCGFAALAAMLFVPIVYAGFPLAVVLLLAPILVYWRYRNEQVPESKRFYLTGDSITASLARRKQAKASRSAVIEFRTPSGDTRPVPLKDDPLFEIHMIVEDILGPALDARATHVELAVGAKGAAVAQTIDGVRYKREPIPAESAVKVVDYLKSIAKLDVEDRRRRQTVEFSMDGPGGRIPIALTTSGSSSNLQLRLDFDRAKRLSKPIDGLGLLAPQLESVRTVEVAEKRHGFVLVGAPSGHGLSTTCYSLLGRHDAYTSNIKTLEREILLRIDGVDHVRFDPTNPDIDYATNLQSIIRRDPDIMLAGVVEDAATAQVITNAGSDGPLIYVPQRAGTITEQIRDWVKLVGDVKQATRGLRLVINQRLMRSLCPNCRQAYAPTEDQLKKLGLPKGKVQQLFKAGGKVQVKNKIEDCPVCQGLGYLGQTAAFEVLLVDSETRKHLGAGDLKAALAHARRNKMIYLQEAALAKVASGETTIEEIVRVTAPPKQKAPARAAAKPAATA